MGGSDHLYPVQKFLSCIFLMQVHQLHIDYAKSAKRLDVKKLKMKMWQIITEHIPDGKGDSPDDKENTVPVSYQTVLVQL